MYFNKTAEHAVLRARPRSARATTTTTSSDANVRLTWQATPKQKVSLLTAHAGLLPLLQHARRHRRHDGSGIDLRLPDVSEQPVPGQLELSGNAEAPARGRDDPARRASSRPEARRDRQRTLGERADHRDRLRLAVQRRDDVAQQLRRPWPAGPVHDAVRRVVRHRIAFVQGGRSSPSRARRRSAANQSSTSSTCSGTACRCRSTQVAFPHQHITQREAWTSGSSRRISGRSRT